MNYVTERLGRREQLGLDAERRAGQFPPATEALSPAFSGTTVASMTRYGASHADSEYRGTMNGDLDTIVALAADVERWPVILPHYRWVTLLDGGGDRKTVEMAARRGRIPGQVAGRAGGRARRRHPGHPLSPHRRGDQGDGRRLDLRRPGRAPSTSASTTNSRRPGRWWAEWSPITSSARISSPRSPARRSRRSRRSSRTGTRGSTPTAGRDHEAARRHHRHRRDHPDRHRRRRALGRRPLRSIRRARDQPLRHLGISSQVAGRDRLRSARPTCRPNGPGGSTAFRSSRSSAPRWRWTTRG